MSLIPENHRLLAALDAASDFLVSREIDEADRDERMEEYAKATAAGLAAIAFILLHENPDLLDQWNHY